MSRRRGGCAARHGHGGNCRPKWGADVGQIVWFGWSMGLGRRWMDAERVAGCCFVPQVLVGVARLATHATMVVHRGEVYTAGAPVPGFAVSWPRSSARVEATGGRIGQAGGLGGSPRRAAVPRSTAYGLAAGPSSHETGRPDVLLHRAAVVTAIISTLLSDGPASRVVRKPVARTPR